MADMVPGPAEPAPARPVPAADPVDESLVERAGTEVAEFFLALEKAVRARRLYQPNNPVYQGFLAALHQAAGRVWDQLPALSVSVAEHSFSWHARTFATGEHRDSLAFLFYRDGIRYLTFLPGFEQEIEAFLGVLHRARLLDQSADDDMVTLLWQAEFVNFQYTYVDALAEGLVLPEAAGEQLVDRHIDLAAGERAEQAAAAPAPYAVESGQPPVSQIVTREDFAETLYFLDGAELDQLNDMVRQELARDFRRDVLNALFDRLEEPNTDRRTEILGILRQLLPTFLGSGELAAATHQLQELSEIQRRDVLEQREREEAAAMFRELSEPAVLSQLLLALENGSIDPARPELGIFLSHLGPEAMPLLLKAIETSTVPALQERLRQAMRALAEANRPQLVSMLRAESVEVVRGAARIVAQLTVPEAVPSLTELLRHPGVELRRVAVETLAAIRNAPALDALRAALDDGDREVRIAAARGLGTARYVPARGALEEMVKGRAMREFDLTEKIAFFEAFGAVAAPESVPLLDRLLNGRRLFGRESAELRACAAMALGRMAAPAARTALQKAAEDPEPLVRNAVVKALRQDGGRS
ncbi:MAG TPA: HEAT repeat domain-containing protein [Longimicrobiales bacterium]|nr:HEAT repeat domain-containing protein [Longimicrobiales bacterium]